MNELPAHLITSCARIYVCTVANGAGLTAASHRHEALSQFEEAGRGLHVAAYTLLDYRCDCVNKKNSSNTCVALAKPKYMGPALASDRSDCATGSFTAINGTPAHGD